jgi:hypothetical protein
VTRSHERWDFPRNEIRSQSCKFTTNARPLAGEDRSPRPLGFRASRESPNAEFGGPIDPNSDSGTTD